MKRLICFAISFMLAVSSAAAENGVTEFKNVYSGEISVTEIINTNFSGYEVPSAISLSMWSGAETLASVFNNEDCLIYRQPNIKEGSYILNISDEQKNLLNNGILIVKTKIYFDTFNTRTRILDIEGKEGRGALAEFSGDGFIYAGGFKARNYGRYYTRRWYDLSIAIDFARSMYSMAIDDKDIVENMSIGLKNINLSNIRFMQSYPAKNETGIVLFDDMQVYIMNSTLSQADFEILPLPEKQANHEALPHNNALFAPTPTAKEIAGQIKNMLEQKQHPYLLATKEDIENAKISAEKNKTAKKWYNQIIEKANSYLSKPPFFYSKSGIMTSARNMLDYGKYLGVAYCLTGDKKYAEHAYVLMESCTQFDDWNPSHFLDTAEMTAALSICCDLIYDALDTEQKEKIMNAIYEKGLLIGYNTFTKDGDPYASWRNKENNWCQVCNGGLITGAIMYAEHNPDFSAELIEFCHSAMKRGLSVYNPDGSYFEGPGYWAYSTRYLCMAMASMQNFLGSDYGYTDFKPIENTAIFGMYLNGIIGNFNYNDGGSGFIIDDTLSFLARNYGLGNVAGYVQNVKKEGEPFDLLWFYNKDDAAMPDKDMCFKDYPMFFTHSEDNFKNTGGIWAALKGQKGSSSRMDLDCGSFMLEAMGVRWTEDPGTETYSTSVGYWDVGNNGARYKYYMKRAEGHNTVVINPDKNADQIAQCYAPITEYESGADGSYAVVDMKPAYEDKVINYKRGMKLFDGRSKVMLSDEIEMKKPSEFYWFMHTEADIKIYNDGKRAVLSKNDKRLLVLLNSNASLEFSVLPSNPLPQTITGVSNANIKANKLTIHGTDITNLKLDVLFVPLREEDSFYLTENFFENISSWNVSESRSEKTKNICANSITLGGKPLKGFDPDIYDYDVAIEPWIYSGMPDIEVFAPKCYSTMVLSAKDLPCTAKIMLKNENNPKEYNYYTLNISHMPNIIIPESGKQLLPLKIVPSDVPEPNNHEGNLHDNNIATKWAAYADQWIRLEYEKAERVFAVGIAVMEGNTRVHPFEVYVSEDGEKWREVYKGKTTAGTEEVVYYEFEETDAKYVRVDFHGSQVSLWNSITELWTVGK